MAKKIIFKKTEDIRKTNAEEAIDAWVRNDDNQAVKVEQEPKSEIKIQRMSIDIPEDIHRKLKNTCVLEGISIKDKVINLLIRELNI
jgi:hypothetical protein